jgi:hypothetical protein
MSNLRRSFINLGNFVRMKKLMGTSKNPKLCVTLP